MGEIQTSFVGLYTQVDVAPVAECFIQAGVDLGLGRKELALKVAERIGFVEDNLSQGFDPDTANAKAIYGVLQLLGLSRNSQGTRRAKIDSAQAILIAYVLRLLEDDLA
jgi:hypothetical protein